MPRSDRTEKPTPKRRREAQKKGQTAQSKEVASALVYATSVLFFAGYSSVLLGQFQGYIRSLWRDFLLHDMDFLTVKNLFFHSSLTVMKLAAPLIGLTLAVAVLSSGAQSGFSLSGERLKWHLSSLSPVKNLGRIFSSRGLAELAKTLAIIGVAVYIAYSVIVDRLAGFELMALMDIRATLGFFGNVLFTVTARIAFLLVGVAVFDFFFQKHRFEEDLKQTKQEVKEDMKETEGDPLVKGRIRALQREMARRRMMSAVKEADVIITNPTEYAVALKYEMERMSAPLVVAKGRGHLARRIKDVAAEHNIPTVENVPLAQALYKSVEVGREIPANLYHAVAQILAYVYRLKQEHWH